MDITPKQFNALLNELKEIRKHLAQLLQKSDEQTSAENAARKSQEDNRNVQPVWLDPVLAKYKQPEANRKVEAKEQHGVQSSARWANWFTFGATLLAFIAAAYYAYTANRQLTTSQEQTGLLVKQAEVLAAIVKANPGMQIESGIVQIGFMNTGHLPASSVCAILTISKRKLPGEQLEGDAAPWNICVPQLVASTEAWDQHETVFYISPAEMDRIRKTDLTIRMEGTISYNNGFTKESFPICISYLWVQTKDALIQPGNTHGLMENGPFACGDEFRARLESALK